jgi:hypothetical protein
VATTLNPIKKMAMQLKLNLMWLLYCNYILVHFIGWSQETKHNDTQHNDTQHDGTQHNDTQHKNK